METHEATSYGVLSPAEKRFVVNEVYKAYLAGYLENYDLPDEMAAPHLLKESARYYIKERMKNE